MNNLEQLYGEDYFDTRKENDHKRVQSFLQEKDFIAKYSNLDGVVCDVGCSTGEFLKVIGYVGVKYGMEISEYAKTLAIVNGISFDKNLYTDMDYFDIIVFRGTIQHIPDPFIYIDRAFKALKPGGLICFLATPNANSLIYKIFNTLPVLEPKLNFYIPSDKTLTSVLENQGFEILEIQYPYWHSPYSRVLRDFISFLKCFVTRQEPDFAFPGNMMNIVARKNLHEK
jgi:SAM-dependent methyltransferase